MANRDKELISLICQDCGKSFTLTYGRYRRLPADNHWRCKSCNNIKRSLMFANLTDDERKKLHDQRSAAAKKTWEDLTLDEYMRRSESQRKRWAKLSKEEKDILLENTRKAQLEYIRSPEIRSKLAQRNRDHWAMLTEEERAKEIERLNWMRDTYWNSLTNREKFIKMSKMWSANQGTIGPTEYIFNDYLQSIGMKNGVDYYWSFNTYPYINPKYFDIFGKINKVTGEENIPYHSWDFILFPNSEYLSMLIDIDGSAHDPDRMLFKRGNNNYTEREKIDYNDSQRKYQIPDGIDAFVIKAHNDELLPSTIVSNVLEPYCFDYNNLLMIIKDRFLHPKECIKAIAESSTTIDQLQCSRNTALT